MSDQPLAAPADMTPARDRRFQAASAFVAIVAVACMLFAAKISWTVWQAQPAASSVAQGIDKARTGFTFFMLMSAAGMVAFSVGCGVLSRKLWAMTPDDL